MRGALLLLWAESWQESPCGTLPNNDELIALMIDMAPAVFKKHRAVLLRGWTLADDGRLYHETITERVLAMLEKRASDAKRSKTRRERAQASAANPAGDTAASCVTHAGDSTDSGASSTPSTKHQAPGGGSSDEEPPPGAGVTPTPASAVCIALKAAGIGNVNPSHPELAALVDAGATVEEFVGAVRASEGKGDRFAYVIAVVAGQRKRAAATAGAIHHGPLRVVGKQAALEAKNDAHTAAWLASMQGAVDAT